MNVFIIARGYPTKQDPIWGCFEKDQAAALVQFGHQVTILSVDARFRFYWRPLGIQHVQENTISAYNIFLCPYALLFFIPKRLRDRFFAWQLDKLYQRAVRDHNTPDVIYSHYLKCTQKAVRLKNKYHIPLIAIEHWSALNIRPIPKYIKYIVENTYPYVNQLIAVSEPLKKSMEDFQTNMPISVVHNMVGKEFQYDPTCAQQQLTFISTGRLVYGKGFDVLVNALYLIQDKLPKDWQAIIVGDGKEKQTLQQLINTYNLQKHIFLVGQKNKKDIVKLLQQSHIFLFPSRGENFSVAVLEALACGLPVVASICGGIRECINSQNGLLFPVDDTDALANAIIQMLDNIQQYDKLAIAQDCQNRFAPEVIAKQLTTIFENTIKQTKEK